MQSAISKSSLLKAPFSASLSEISSLSLSLSIAVVHLSGRTNPDAMESDFSDSVESGLKLAKRIYNGKDRFVSAPKPLPAMDKSPPSRPTYHPTALMVYAVISDPAIVDNPDIPSYQPHVHGRCDPPVLIPLQMNEIGMEVDCNLDTAFVKVKGSWRVHCVMGSRSCDCQFVVPMGEQGSILGVEVDIHRKSFSTQLMRMEETQDLEKTVKSENGGMLGPQMFCLTIPQVDGGSVLSITVSWSQRLMYSEGQFSVSVPFNFPEYIVPPGKRFPTKERIQLNVDTGIGKEVMCKTTSHPLKEKRRQVGKLFFLYEADVITWSSTDFHFSYMVPLSDILGGLLLQSPSVDDFDQREIFCLYLFPGNTKNRKVFRKEVIFLVDISGSMRGKPLENAKIALTAALFKLTPVDSFSIIAYNGEIHVFSSSLELATMEIIEKATKWMSDTCVAGGETNILTPLNEAMEMLSDSDDSITHIFLITDGAVEDERNICQMIKDRIDSRGSRCPRISTFGIGLYCNHYFLRMLALIGRGHYDSAYDADLIVIRIQRWFTTASSPILANITIDIFDQNDAFEVYPFPIPDLSSECPLLLSGRYEGNFPDSFEAKGIFADTSSTVIDLKVLRAKDITLDKIFAKRQIDMLTAQAWFSESKQLEETVAKMSIQTGVTSEYTRMVLIETDKQKLALESAGLKEAKKIGKRKKAASQEPKKMPLHGLSIGFGNVAATNENTPSGFGEPKVTESDIIYEKTSRCCHKLSCCCCCCPCCINVCSKMNDHCVILITQLCTALSCLGCMVCVEACCPDDN